MESKRVFLYKFIFEHGVLAKAFTMPGTVSYLINQIDYAHSTRLPKLLMDKEDLMKFIKNNRIIRKDENCYE